MSHHDDLKHLSPILLALPAHMVRQPDLPVATFCQEGLALHAFLESRKDVEKTLRDVGVKKKVIDDLPTSITALLAAEGHWNAVSGRHKDKEQKELEERAADLRSHLVAACRWNLEDNRAAQGALDAIQEGSGLADLAGDLETLGALIEIHKKSFKNDKTFDADAQAELAHTTAKALRAGGAAEHLPGDRAEALDLRNRAYTYADGIVERIRRAGRYAYRLDDEVVSHFRSDYELDRARRSRRLRAETPVDAEVEPVEG